MKIKCINVGRNKYITLNKDYETFYMTKNYYEIINDKGITTCYNKRHFKEVKEDIVMTKDMLKSGMVVETKERGRWLVVNDTMINTSEHMIISKYEEDLTYYFNDAFTITKVFDIQLPHLTHVHKLSQAENMVWKRKEVKEMTIEQIEKELGYTIKVIK